MPIQSMFYSIVIPIENLRKILTKGQMKKILLARNYNGEIWFDDYLYLERSGGATENDAIIKFWRNKGLAPIKIRNGEESWRDLCLVQSPELEPALPCAWLEFFTGAGEDSQSIYIGFKGKPRDDLIKTRRPVEEFMEKW